MSIVRYKASTPDSKYLGAYLKAFTDNLKAYVVEPILEKYHIAEIDPAGWMDAQLQLDMIRDIEARCNFEELVAVGMKAGEIFPLPPEIDSLEKFLDLSPQMHASGLRDAAPEENLRVEKLAANHYRLIWNIPFPPFVMYGTTYGVLKRIRGNDYPVITIIGHNGTPYVFDVKW